MITSLGFNRCDPEVPILDEWIMMMMIMMMIILMMMMMIILMMMERDLDGAFITLLTALERLENKNVCENSFYNLQICI